MHVSNPKVANIESSFLILSKKIKDLGYRTIIKERLSVLEFSSHLILHTLFFILAIYFSYNILFCFLFLFLMMLSGIGVTTGTHTASHYSLVRNRKVNTLMVYLGYGFFFGSSREYWMHKHIKVHHPNPNIVGVDEDINLMPWFVMSRDDYENASGFKKKYFRIQFLIIPLALTLNLFNVQKDGLVHLYECYKKEGVTKRIITDLMVIFSHFLCWIIIPLFFFDVADVMLFYYLRAAFMGYGMFAAFAPAHFPDNAIFLSTDNKEMNFILKQIYTTTNFRTGIIGKYVLGGVQYQIEHHLFPSCHHYHYPKINTLLIEFCKENDIPYNELGWFEGIWKSYQVFYKPKEIYTNVNALES